MYVYQETNTRWVMRSKEVRHYKLCRSIRHDYIVRWQCIKIWKWFRKNVLPCLCVCVLTGNLKRMYFHTESTHIFIGMYFVYHTKLDSWGKVSKVSLRRAMCNLESHLQRTQDIDFEAWKLRIQLRNANL